MEAQSGERQPWGERPGGFEDAQRLRNAVQAALADPSRGESVAILDREPNAYGSTFRSEIVRCRLSRVGAASTSDSLTLFVKRGPAYHDPHTGHARGVPREIEVYRDVLPHLSVARPEFLGAVREPGPGAEAWLCLRHLAEGVRIDETGGGWAIRRGAEELAGLHSEGEVFVARGGRRSLNGYGRTYLERFVRRWNAAAECLGEGRPWIRALSQRIHNIVDLLDAPNPTVVHGEAYVGNIVLLDDRPIILDWESAGVGLGELDLAALLARWPEEEAREAEAAYVRARWPQGAPDSFPTTLRAARLHALIRILHRQLPDGRDTRRVAIILAEIRIAGEQLGLLS